MPGLSQTRAYVALVAIVALWGSYPATAKLAIQDFPPFFLAAVRCSVASCFLVYRLARSGADTPRDLSPRALRVFLVLGLAGIWGSTQFSYVAYYYTTAGNAVILQAAAPVMVALTARFYLGERLSGVQWLGVAVSAFGVLLVITSGRLAALRLEELRPGDFLTLATLTGWSVYTVYGKRVLGALSPALATTGAYVAGTLLVLPTALVAAPFYPAPRLGSLAAWAVVLYQGLFGAVAHVWWYRAVQVVGPSRSAIFMNLQPIVGVLLATLLLSEALGLWQFAGGACVLGGVTLTIRAQASPETV
ncbi:MAG: DMT family transporter [Candidatus Rokuibacteriota bacterium]